MYLCEWYILEKKLFDKIIVMKKTMSEWIQLLKYKFDSKVDILLPFVTFYFQIR